MRSLTIDRCEVDGLRAGSHFRGYFVDWNPKNDGRRLTMDVPAGVERVDERRVSREVSKQPELDLRVVSREEEPPLSRNEPSTNVSSEFTTNRNVLEVRVTRRETSGGCDRLVEGRVQPLVVRMDERRERIEICVFELR